jgi:hypothetical protein
MSTSTNSSFTVGDLTPLQHVVERLNIEGSPFCDEPTEALIRLGRENIQTMIDGQLCDHAFFVGAVDKAVAAAPCRLQEIFRRGLLVEIYDDYGRMFGKVYALEELKAKAVSKPVFPDSREQQHFRSGDQVMFWNGHKWNKGEVKANPFRRVVVEQVPNTAEVSDKATFLVWSPRLLLAADFKYMLTDWAYAALWLQTVAEPGEIIVAQQFFA